MRLKEQFFDFEVFPQWWCCVIGEYPRSDEIPETIKNTFTVITSDDKRAKEKLMFILNNREYVNFGYNNKRYDNIIYNAIIEGLPPEQIRMVSDLIINPELEYESVEYARLAPLSRKRYYGFIFQDMLDDNTGSLKEKEACMQLDIRESDVPFDKVDLTEEDKADIIDYCKHDVWSGMQFYKQVLKSFIATKLLVGKTFGLTSAQCYSSTNAVLSGIVLGAKKTSFPDANRQDIVIPKELREYVNYSLPANIIDQLIASPEKFDAFLFSNIVSYSNGGIHSIPAAPDYVARFRPGEILSAKMAKMAQLNNLQVKSDDEWKLINVDAASFYPAMMIYYETLSRAVGRPELFREMFEARLSFKQYIDPFEQKYIRDGEFYFHEASETEYVHYVYCKDTSQAYKLILNTTFGASGNKYLPLYDPYMTTKTCRLGQLLITSFANNVYNAIGKDKVQIIQSNTDGVLFYIHKDSVDLLHQVGDVWTEVTKIVLEYEDEDTIWQRDVNNYLLYKNTGKEKSKGGFFVTDMIQPGYNRVRPLDIYISREAVKWYLKEGRDIVDHIYNEKDVSRFICTSHKGSFSGMMREFNDGRPNETLHKVNRMYASTDTSLGMVYRVKKYKGELRKYKAPGCPPHCQLLNKDLSTYKIEELKDLDYMWYIERTVDLLKDEWWDLTRGKYERLDILNNILD